MVRDITLSQKLSGTVLGDSELKDFKTALVAQRLKQFVKKRSAINVATPSSFNVTISHGNTGVIIMAYYVIKIKGPIVNRLKFWNVNQFCLTG